MAGKGLTWGELKAKLRELEVRGIIRDDSLVVMETPSEERYYPVEGVNFSDTYLHGEHITVLRLNWRRVIE